MAPLYYEEEPPYGEPAARPAPRRPAAPPRPPKRPRVLARLLGWLLALAALAGIGTAAWLGAKSLFNVEYADYQGAGKGGLIIQVAAGASTRDIGNALVRADSVASLQAFLDAAAKRQDEMLAIHPGYYQVKSKMSGAAAVDALLADGARVGAVEIRGGAQLHDLHGREGKAVPGILTRISQASCGELGAKRRCVSVKALEAVADQAAPADLGVPQWLASRAAQAPDGRRLEGLIMPGLYDIQPGWDAQRVLQEILSVSATRLEALGMPSSAEQAKQSPYDVLVVASIIEREGVRQDFGKVARVIYNRLKDGQRLEMDSTINYVLERPHIRTSGADRQRPGPYNTYRNTELPPTPISAPSSEAVQAALAPPKGDWVYFVKCEESGLSCFTAEYDEHVRNVKEAQERGVW